MKVYDKWLDSDHMREQEGDSVSEYVILVNV